MKPSTIPKDCLPLRMADVNLTTNLRYYLPSLPEPLWFYLTSKHNNPTHTNTPRSWRGNCIESCSHCYYYN